MDGLFRASATERDLGHRRVLVLTALVGLTGAAAVWGLMVGLVPAGAGQPPGVAPDSHQPVATSGSS